MIGGAVGSLFVLFGVNTNQESFKIAKDALNTLKAASAITGVVRLGQDLAGMAIHAAESATHILGLSAGLGMSTKSVQEWSYIAEQAGSNVKQFATGVGMLVRNLHAFAEGRASKSFTDAMKHVGISQTQVNKDILHGTDGVNTAIFRISDAYKSMGKEVLTTALNQGLFGARSREMVQDLGQGSPALRAQIQHLHDIGGVVDEDKLLKLKTFGNSINDLKTQLHALAMEATAAVAPGFTEMLQGAVKWVSENKELISDVLIGSLKALGAAFKVVMVIVEAFVYVLNMIGNEGVQAALITIAALLTYALTPALYLVAGAVWAAMAPLLLPAAIIGGIIYAVLLLRKHWDEVTQALGVALDWVIKKATLLGAFFKDGFIKAIGVFKELGLAILHLIPGGESLIGLFTSLGESVWDGLVGVWAHVIKAARVVLDWIEAKLDTIKEGLASVRDFFVGSEGKTDAQGNQTQTPTKAGFLASMVAGTIGLGPLVESMQPTANPPAGSAAAVANSNTSRTTSVSVGPTTVNINGVQGAAQARDNIAEAIDGVHRHAAAAMGGEVQ